jgi:Domain of unknown function (DUF4266)
MKARLVALAAALLLLGGCTAVAPWERGTLAQPQMASDPWPLQRALRAHVQASREGIAPPGSAEGGGCGCY